MLVVITRELNAAPIGKVETDLRVLLLSSNVLTTWFVTPTSAIALALVSACGAIESFCGLQAVKMLNTMNEIKTENNLEVVFDEITLRKLNDRSILVKYLASYFWFDDQISPATTPWIGQFRWMTEFKVFPDRNQFFLVFVPIWFVSEFCFEVSRN